MTCIEFSALTVGAAGDTVVKARLYARAGIVELWLLLTRDGIVEVYRAPGPDGYASVIQHGSG